MKFLSIREYFYRLSNQAIVMVTIALMSVGVAEFSRGLHAWIEDESALVVLAVVSLLTVVELTIVNWWFVPERIRAIRQEFSLGIKLERYAGPVLFRLIFFVSAIVMQSVGYFLTGHTAFLIVAAAVLAVMLMFWPTRQRACRELQLKPDQRQMVLHDLDMR